MKKLIVLAVLAGACATRPAQTPAESFAALESQLIAAKSMNLDYDITSSGAVDVHATGTLRSRGDDVLINVAGETGGERTTATYDVNSGDVRRAVVLGFTRMGLLHNLVRLLGNQEIEKNDVEVTNVAFDPAERKYSFDIVVEGEPTGAAGLWLDARGTPVRRQQTVNFPGGHIFVEERYTWH